MEYDKADRVGRAMIHPYFPLGEYWVLREALVGLRPQPGSLTDRRGYGTIDRQVWATIDPELKGTRTDYRYGGTDYGCAKLGNSARMGSPRQAVARSMGYSSW